MWQEADVRDTSIIQLHIHFYTPTSHNCLMSQNNIMVLNWFWHMLPDQNCVLLCFLIPNALPSCSLHDRRVLFGKLWPFKLHIHPKSLKLFTREHRSAVRIEKHTVLPNCRCSVTSKIEHVMWSWCCNLSCVLESVTSWPAEVWRSNCFLFPATRGAILSNGLWQHRC